MPREFFLGVRSSSVRRCATLLQLFYPARDVLPLHVVFGSDKTFRQHQEIGELRGRVIRALAPNVDAARDFLAGERIFRVDHDPPRRHGLRLHDVRDEVVAKVAESR